MNIARLALVAGLVAVGSAAANERQPSRLCPDDPRTSQRPPIENSAKRSLAEFLGIAPHSTVVHYRSGDWRSAAELESRVRELLKARPRFLSPHINWAEGANFRLHAFVATIQMSDGAAVRLEVAGYQVCVRDTRGDYWYFRHVPIDVWPAEL